MYSTKDHTFIICAYGEHPDLENCILSVLNQTVLGNVIISTSTPNKYITDRAKKYNLPLVINTGKGDQVDNLNFAYSQANTELVTLCHQDVIYCPEYLKNILSYTNKGKQLLILYTDYFEIRDGVQVDSNMLLTVKRTLNFPLRFSVMWSSKWIRRRILSMGNPICCPSVTFNKSKIEGLPFTDRYQGSFDWDAWERISSLEGDFIYCSKRLVGNGISKGSGTTSAIENGIRRKEDFEMFCRFWPPVFAKILVKIYSKSENSNTLKSNNQ